MNLNETDLSVLTKKRSGEAKWLVAKEYLAYAQKSRSGRETRCSYQKHLRTS